MSASRRHVLAVTGASGMVFARCLLRRLIAADSVAEVHFIASDAGRRVAACELPGAARTAADLAEAWVAGVARRARLVVHPVRDVGAAPASGSFRHDGMAIVPCTTATAAAVASGVSTNLIQRAAECSLKERLPLLLMVRETPLSVIHLENLLRAARAGAVVMPLSPPWYHGPQGLDDLVEDTCDRALDHLGLPDLVRRRWEGAPPAPASD